MPKIIKHHLKIYPIRIHVILGKRLKKCMANYKYEPRKNENCYAHTIYTATAKGNSVVCIVLNLDGKYPIHHSTISHESVHAAGFVFHHVGARYEFENDESFAYLTDHIVSLVYKSISDSGMMSKIKPVPKYI